MTRERFNRNDRRRTAADKATILPSVNHPSTLGHDDTSTSLHHERLEAVTRVLLDSGVTTVVDLGCGSGALLRRLVMEQQLTCTVGVDTSLEALQLAESLLSSICEVGGDRLSLVHGSLTDADPRLLGFDAAVMVETIEHVAPPQLSRVERAVFGWLRPGLVIITTPNCEYNVRYGIPPGQFRHAEHWFEWSRSKFQSWATGVATRNGYQVAFDDIGPVDPCLGSPTQMGVFRREVRNSVK